MWTEIIYHAVTKGPYENTLRVFPEPAPSIPAAK